MCNHYNDFNELPQHYKDKFNPDAQNKYIPRMEKSYIKFINNLEANNDTLVGEYTNAKKDISIYIHKCGHTPLISPNSYNQNPKQCPICSNHQIVEGVNDVLALRPDLKIYIMNLDDVKGCSKTSKKEINVMCPYCRHKEKITIASLVRKSGNFCPLCSNGSSYPERVVAILLNRLNVNFKTQFHFNGKCRSPKRYDILTGDNCILEIHGGQHYSSKHNWHDKSYEEEHENDLLKYDMAVIHGYEFNKNYFVIDARESSIQWIKNSLENCKYFHKYDLHNIDWHSVDIEARQTMLGVSICDFYMNNKGSSTTEIAEVYGVSKNTVINYLKWGAQCNICDYVPDKTNKPNKIYVYMIDEKGNKVFSNKMSLSELGRATGIDKSVLRGRLTTGKPLSGINAKFDKKYIGKKIIRCDE